MRDEIELQKILKRIDGRGYKAYNDIKGSYQFKFFRLHIDHVQRDPFAGPSLLRVELDQITSFPQYILENHDQRVAVSDFISRAFNNSIKKFTKNRSGSGKSGIIQIDSGAQEILERTCVTIKPGYLEVRFSIGLPARGRRIMGNEASKILIQILPKIVEDSCFYENINHDHLQREVKIYEDAKFLRDQLKKLGLVAFIRDDSILPRESGVSDKPKKNAVPFKSPDSLSVTIETPNHGPVTGMGIPVGVTLIVGGGYHGKSTLLQAIERGIYNHICGDGREWVVTDNTTVKIRAEDGRRIDNVDISSFIHNPPMNKDTVNFSTENASGSTSQAANIIEALELGCELLLFDEDTSATNFMIRDERMQRLVSREKEPITPFIDRVQELYNEHHVSTVIVMGGSGDYFEVADTVIMMDNYRPEDVTSKAMKVKDELPVNRKMEANFKFHFKKRCPVAESIKPFKGRKIKLDVRGRSTILMGVENIDLSQVEQLMDTSQTRAIAFAMYHASLTYMDSSTSMKELVNQVENDIEQNGLDILALKGRKYPNNLAKPRKFELGAALNRLRTFKTLKC
jgi:predicted ABC-class ATPase